MAELWRVIPQGTDRPADHIWTTRESLDRSIAEWALMMFDRRQPLSVRNAASRLAVGVVQVAASVVWVDSE